MTKYLGDAKMGFLWLSAAACGTCPTHPRQDRGQGRHLDRAVTVPAGGSCCPLPAPPRVHHVFCVATEGGLGFQGCLTAERPRAATPLPRMLLFGPSAVHCTKPQLYRACKRWAGGNVQNTVGGAVSAQQRNDTANHIRHKPRPAAGGASLLCPRLRLHHATPVPRTARRTHHNLNTQSPTDWPRPLGPPPAHVRTRHEGRDAQRRVESVCHLSRVDHVLRSAYPAT
ncbi:hypothetical protein E2C01_074805 [Portunus trituberculatus]|uniref:Uncharacterized protein n=1 Tax=Portunus trituberculatus TaxID=210409 RepID=A0A5B7I6T2_PORTR|nr:hypothetical protein [Portunus trituberculatus]